MNNNYYEGRMYYILLYCTLTGPLVAVWGVAAGLETVKVLKATLWRCLLAGCSGNFVIQKLLLKKEKSTLKIYIHIYIYVCEYIYILIYRMPTLDRAVLLYAMGGCPIAVPGAIP